jgi:hypothetical protein
MRRSFSVLLTAGLLLGCVMVSGDGRDEKFSKVERRAIDACIATARARGLRVERVGRVEKFGKKEYDVALRIDPGRKDNRKKDDRRLRCRYDDKSRRAVLR